MERWEFVMISCVIGGIAFLLLAMGILAHFRVPITLGFSKVTMLKIILFSLIPGIIVGGAIGWALYDLKHHRHAHISTHHLAVR